MNKNNKIKQIQEEYDKLGLNSCSVPEEDGWIFESAMNITESNNILEIGFYKGGSAFIMLSLDEGVNLTSVDPIDGLASEAYQAAEQKQYDEKLKATEKVKEKFDDRFTFIRKYSQDVRPDLEGQSFDMIFIDGDHWESGIRNDFQLMLDLKIPYALVDDWIQPNNCHKSVPTVWAESFQDKLKMKTVFFRHAISCNGGPIPVVLLENLTL